MSGATGIAGAMTASTVAAVEIATATGGAAAGAAAASSSIVGTTLLGIGPAGWAILTVGLVGAGLYFAYQAGETTDDPIESWLKRSIVGKAPSKFTAQMEVDGYNALYSLPLEVTLTGSGSSGMHSIDARINAPALDTRSMLVYELVLTLADGSQETVREELALNAGKGQALLSSGLRSRRADGVQLHALSRHSPPTAQVRWRVDGPMRMPGSINPATGQILQRKQHSIQSVQLTVRYYPLGLKEPGLCIPDAKGKVESYAPL
ncbi:MAG: hypothetical protein C4K60_03430 [Ideonella sp. MAG2]|nr:MAG: hypothetical protein C4K60_03430 [Ideonella sp. MAG2]